VFRVAMAQRLLVPIVPQRKEGDTPCPMEPSKTADALGFHATGCLGCAPLKTKAHTQVQETARIMLGRTNYVVSTAAEYEVQGIHKRVAATASKKYDLAFHHADGDKKYLVDFGIVGIPADVPMEARSTTGALAKAYEAAKWDQLKEKYVVTPGD
jgi:methenyltetrahydromethanopterin cyclohydrolase